MVLVSGGLAEAGVSPLWQQLGGSASGNGVSQTPSPKAVFDGSVAVGSNGRPVVAYTEYPDANAAQGAITVKRWTGSAWEILSGAAGIGQGYEPRVRVSASGAIYVAWLKDDSSGNTEIHLRVRTGTTFDQLGGSDSPGGISGANGGITVPYSLALDASGNPLVAFLGLATNGVVDAGSTPAIIDGTVQVYVRGWTGSSWQFIGADFTGGGASHAVSFTNGGSTVFHDVDAPSLVVDSTGAPVVAFTYFTTIDGVTSDNTDVYVTRWNGATWTAVGPAVPNSASSAGLGGAGGVSNTNTGAFSPALAAKPTGGLAVAWEEEPAGGGVFIYVRAWNGSSWIELDGSASGIGFAQPDSVNFLPDIAIDPDGRPVVAWQGTLAAPSVSQIFVLRWNGTDAWEELGLDSASDAGISDAVIDALVPSLALTPSGGAGAAGVPTVAWLDVRATGSAQVFLRQFFSGTTVPLTVSVSGDGSVSSNPIGVECGSGTTCVTDFPIGASVTLIPEGGATGAFGSWSGACTGSGACTVVMSAARSVNASFVAGVRLAVSVSGPGGRVSSAPAGITTCAESCSAGFPTGTPVTLTATTVPGGTFAGWGDACAFRGTNTTCALNLAANTSVSAAFTLKSYQLTVTVATPANTTGQGVIGEVGGPVIACTFADGTCTTPVGQGSTVLLVATPDQGNRFLNWTGGPCAGRTTTSCSFTMTANTSVTALFRGATFVQVLRDGNGAGTVTGPGLSCGADCFESIFTGTNVTLTPTPTTGSRFAGWSGDVCDGQPSGACAFQAAGVSTTVSATFQLTKQRLTLAPSGAGFTVSSPGGIDCGSGGHIDCTQDYDYGTAVTLTPTVDVDSTLASWTGCTSLNGSICTVLMTANRTVTPKFVAAHTLQVSASGNGSGKIVGTGTPALSCVANCSVSRLYPATTSVTLTPQPAVGTNFAWLTGDCSGTAACTLPMTANHSAVGRFALNRQSLIVTDKSGGSVANTVALPGGAAIDCGTSGNACSGVFDYGTAVSLQATADAGFVFVNWTGTACAGSTNTTCAFALKSNVSITPNFRARTFVTVIKAGTGSGTVTGPGISCGADCSENEFDGKAVKLTAVPAVGSHFDGFGGDCASPSTTCTFTPSGNNDSVTATFTLTPYPVTVTSRSNGAVVSNALPDTIACGSILAGGGSDCLASLDFGTQVVLTATPITGSRFVSWTGTVCNGSTNATCAFKVPAANVSVTPSFKDVTTLTLNKGGSGTVTSAPAGISCGAACSSASFDFARGVLIKLTPTASVGWSFDGFTGACSGTTCSLNASTPAALVGANFSIQHRRLTVTVVGQGAVSGPGVSCSDGNTPCALDFDYGTSLPLVAVADPGFRFTGWSQDCAGVGACTPLMTANHSVTATFKPQFALTVAKPGNSTGTITASPAGIAGDPINCGLDCSSLYLGGTVVTLTRSAPITGTTFQWGGACTFRGTNATCALPINANTSVSADYSLQRLGLTVIKNGPALGSVTGLGGAIDCGADCGETVNYGTPVTLVAAANAAPPLSEFVSWSGCTTPATNASCSFTMTTNKTVTATFRPLVTAVGVDALSTGALAVGGVRQLTAMATFTDGSTQDVTTQAAWTSTTTTVATVGATGLVTGRGAGNTSITATFRGLGGSLPITVDTLAAGALTVTCAPYGDTSGLASHLACLPSAMSFSVHCQALGTFNNAGQQDITDQVTWVTSNSQIAKSTGLVAFNGPVRQSFRIDGNGTAILHATQSGKTSPTTGTLGTDAYVLQGVASSVVGLSVTPPSANVAVHGTVPLLATATLSSTTAGCTSPPSRDFSRAAAWTSADEGIADVSFFGAVTGGAPGGPVSVTATVGTFSDSSQITVP
jgi:hypothetical protein